MAATNIVKGYSFENLDLYEWTTGHENKVNEYKTGLVVSEGIKKISLKEFNEKIDKNDFLSNKFANGTPEEIYTFFSYARPEILASDKCQQRIMDYVIKKSEKDGGQLKSSVIVTAKMIGLLNSRVPKNSRISDDKIGSIIATRAVIEVAKKVKDLSTDESAKILANAQNKISNNLNKTLAPYILQIKINDSVGLLQQQVTDLFDTVKNSSKRQLKKGFESFRGDLINLLKAATNLEQYSDAWSTELTTPNDRTRWEKLKRKEVTYDKVTLVEAVEKLISQAEKKLSKGLYKQTNYVLQTFVAKQESYRKTQNEANNADNIKQGETSNVELSISRSLSRASISSRIEGEEQEQNSFTQRDGITTGSTAVERLSAKPEVLERT